MNPNDMLKFSAKIQRMRQGVYQLTGSQSMLLLCMPAIKGPISMSLASEISGVSRAATTSITDKLVDKGLIERCPSSTDRRVIELKLTKVGQEVVENVYARRG